MMQPDPVAQTTVKVWDALVRVGHWLLVGGIVGAWFVHGKWHEWLGYGVLIVVAWIVCKSCSRTPLLSILKRKHLI